MDSRQSLSYVNLVCRAVRKSRREIISAVLLLTLFFTTAFTIAATAAWFAWPSAVAAGAVEHLEENLPAGQVKSALCSDTLLRLITPQQQNERKIIFCLLAPVLCALSWYLLRREPSQRNLESDKTHLRRILRNSVPVRAGPALS